MDERYTLFSKQASLWGDIYLGTAHDSSSVVATLVYPRQPWSDSKECRILIEHFVAPTGSEVKSALIDWLDREFGPHQYDLQLVMLD